MEELHFSYQSFPMKIYQVEEQYYKRCIQLMMKKEIKEASYVSQTNINI